MKQKDIVEKVFDYKEYKCVVIFFEDGHRCGYVGVPYKHPLWGKYYDEIENKFECHGGLTYNSCLLHFEENYPIASNLYYFGFDCAHANDDPDKELSIKVFGKTFYTDLDEAEKFSKENREYIRSIEYVANECLSLAVQFEQYKNEKEYQDDSEELIEFRRVLIDFIKSGGNMELLPEGYYVKQPLYNLKQTVSLCNNKGYSKEITIELLNTYRNRKETN